jgi:transmembrane sensor
MGEEEHNAFLNDEYRRSVWNSIADQIEKEEGTATKIHWFRYAAAALIITVSTILIFLAGQTKPKAMPVATIGYIRMINNTAVPRMMTMKDGSAITMYPNSELVYRRSFGETDRNINLTGKALFNVARNKENPFVVLANSVTTTALGTAFTIVSDSISGEVNVFLHSGKVCVQQNKDLSQKVFLTPGQQLSWKISGIPIIKKNASRPLLVVKKNQTPKPFTINFEQESLPNVFRKLESGFHIHLNYYPEELADLYFSGKVRSTDKPTQVLQRIASLHNLILVAEQKDYSIRKN